MLISSRREIALRATSFARAAISTDPVTSQPLREVVTMNTNRMTVDDADVAYSLTTALLLGLAETEDMHGPVFVHSSSFVSVWCW